MPPVVRLAVFAVMGAVKCVHFQALNQLPLALELVNQTKRSAVQTIVNIASIKLGQVDAVQIDADPHRAADVAIGILAPSMTTSQTLGELDLAGSKTGKLVN